MNHQDPEVEWTAGHEILQKTKGQALRSEMIIDGRRDE